MKRQMISIYINDLVIGVFKIIKNKSAHNQIFNITYGQSRKISDMLDLVKRNFKKCKSKICQKRQDGSKAWNIIYTKSKKNIKV